MTKVKIVHPLKLRAIELERRCLLQAVFRGAIAGGLVGLAAALLLSACVPWPPGPHSAITPSPSLMPSTVTATTNIVETRAPPPEGKVCQVVTGIDAGSLNLRTGPGTSYAVKTILTEGEILSVTEDLGAWLKVTRADNTQGFVNKKYCN